MKYEELAENSIKAKVKSYSPYSKFRVGAALITSGDKLYPGANIENASYGLTICAERTAVFSAILDGEKDFKAIAIASDADNYCPPCGACRQVLLELCGPDLDVILVNSKNETRIFKLNELIPFSFTQNELK